MECKEWNYEKQKAMKLWHVHLDLNEDYPTSKDGVFTNYTMDVYVDICLLSGP